MEMPKNKNKNKKLMESGSSNRQQEEECHVSADTVGTTRSLSAVTLHLVLVCRFSQQLLRVHLHSAKGHRGKIRRLNPLISCCFTMSFSPWAPRRRYNLPVWERGRLYVSVRVCVHVERGEKGSLQNAHYFIQHLSEIKITRQYFIGTCKILPSTHLIH